MKKLFGILFIFCYYVFSANIDRLGLALKKILEAKRLQGQQIKHQVVAELEQKMQKDKLKDAERFQELQKRLEITLKNIQTKNIPLKEDNSEIKLLKQVLKSLQSTKTMKEYNIMPVFPIYTKTVTVTIIPTVPLPSVASNPRKNTELEKEIRRKLDLLEKEINTLNNDNSLKRTQQDIEKAVNDIGDSLKVSLKSVQNM